MTSVSCYHSDGKYRVTSGEDTLILPFPLSLVSIRSTNIGLPIFPDVFPTYLFFLCLMYFASLLDHLPLRIVPLAHLFFLPPHSIMLSPDP